jgi:hypothetical protein
VKEDGEAEVEEAAVEEEEEEDGGAASFLFYRLPPARLLAFPLQSSYSVAVPSPCQPEPVVW